MTRMDAACGAAVGLGALALYVRTLAPGLIPILDTPGFQFVGRVLGTLHNPGYPAYVLITHLWSYLPIGSLAYRINLFSAVTAALAVAGLYVVLRLLDVRRVVAAATSLGMAFGSIYWSQAVIAEVYGLNAALIAWILVAMLGWARTGRALWFYTAVTLLALGLGNHTTIVLFAPGMLAFSLVADRRWVLRPLTIVAATCILAVGVSQYLFILLRTRSGAGYLESKATDLHELFDVMRGAQFEHALFAFSPSQVITERIPLVVGRFIGVELTIPGLVLAAVGIVMLLARRRREAWLLLPSLAATLAFVLNYDAGDIHVFTLPSVLLLWACAGVGAQALLAAISSRSHMAASVAALLLLSVPVYQVKRNFTDRNLSDDTGAMRVMDALFEALPTNSFLVRHNFVLDRMLMYKLFGERAAGTREVQAHYVSAQAAAAMSRSGRHVFAFPETAQEFRQAGVDVSFSPIPLYASTIEERIGSLPEGFTTLLIVPAVNGAGLRSGIGRALERWISFEQLTGRDRTAFVAVIRTGSGAASDLVMNDRSAATARAGEVSASADALVAAIELHGRELVRTEDGPVLVVMDMQGRVDSIDVLSPDHNYRLRSRPGSFTPYRVQDTMPVVSAGTDPIRVPSPSGLVLVRLPADSHLIVSAPGSARCDLRAVDKSSDDLSIESASVMTEDQRALPGIPSSDRHLRIVSGPRAASVMLATGCREEVYGWGASPGVTLHRAAAEGLLDAAGLVRETLLMARTQQAWLLGGGWSAVSTDADGPFRRMEGSVSAVLLPTARRSTGLRVQARCGDACNGRLRLSVDGRTLGDAILKTGWAWYDWEVTGDLSAGVHELRLERVTSGGNAPIDVNVAQIELVGG